VHRERGQKVATAAETASRAQVFAMHLTVLFLPPVRARRINQPAARTHTQAHAQGADTLYI